MSNFDDYFTADDKPFAENINDALLLSNVFDLTVPIQVPTMFRNGAWIDSASNRKCGVAIVTLKEQLPSGVSISTIDGASVLTGTGTVKLGFYPNFNSFGKFKFISWENTGNVQVNLKTVQGTTIVNNISKGVIENASPELRTLQEIVIEIVMSNATLYTMDVTMQNKDAERYGAEVGISDVNDLSPRLLDIEGKNTQQDVRLTALETVDAQIRNYKLTSDNYNVTIDSDITITAKVSDIIHGAVEGESVTLFKNGVPLESKTTDNMGLATWTVTCDNFGLQTFQLEDEIIQVDVGGWKRLAGTDTGDWAVYRNKTEAILVLRGWSARPTGNNYAQFGSASYASNCRPYSVVKQTTDKDLVTFTVDASGTFTFKNTASAAQNVYGQIGWSIRTGDL